MSKHLLTSGYANIPIRDLPIWVKVFKKEGITTAEEMQKELTLIDDLLTLQKRKGNLKEYFEDRIGKK